MEKQQLKGTLLVIFSALAFGIMPTVSNLSFQEGLNVESILFFRFAIATIMIWGYIFLKKIPFKTTKRHMVYLVLLAVLGYVGTSSTFFMAFTYISGSLATILLFTHPAMIAAYEMLVQKSSKDIKKILALTVSTIGIILVVWSKNITINTTGIVLSLLSAVFYSFYILGLEEKKTKEMDAMVVTGYVLLFSALTYLLQGTFLHRLSFPETTMGWIYVFILALFSSVFAIFALCIGVKIVGPTTAAIISTFEPVFAALLGLWITHDVITSNMLIGGLFILSAIFILQVPWGSVFPSSGKGTDLGK